MAGVKNWKTLTVVALMLAIIIVSVAMPGCFRRSSDDSTGSSVPAPGAFTLGVPVDRALINLGTASEVAFNWTASANTATYSLEVSTDDSFAVSYSVYSPTAFASGTLSHSASTTTFVANTLYYWRVTATNASGSTDASNKPFTFYTGTADFMPGAFDCVTPTNLAVPAEVNSSSPPAESLTPQLDWTNATTETFYTVYVATDTSFTSPYTTTTKAGVLTVDIPVSANLTDTTRYYWAVSATGYNLVTNTSTYSFVTGPVKYYTLVPDNSTITAGGDITATLTAYGNNDVTVSSHIPFSITMNAGAGFTYYTNNTFGTVNATRQYTVANGTATIYVRMTSSGANNLIATDPASRTKTAAITVNTAAVNTVTFSTQPANTVAGATMANVVVNVKDAYNNNISGQAVSVTTTNGTLLSGTLSQNTNASGDATFNNLSMTLAGTYALTATAGTVNTASANFNITAAAPNTVTFSTQPANTVAGATMANVVVNVKDAYNNNISGQAVSVTTTNGTLL
ncbi:MAG: hypothetical protein AB1599_01970, partial [Planctomycetota bacterium]